MRHWYRLVGRSSAGARALERDGVVAAIVPAVRERSVVNSVNYEHASGLGAAYDEIAAAYDEIGAKWTVWVHSGDEEAAALLRDHGHVLDAEPEGMALDLTERPVKRPSDEALPDWTRDGDFATLGSVNDRSYSFGTDSFSRALSGLPDGVAHVYTARVNGEPAGVLATVDHGGNAEVQMVAVLPEARGHGLAGKLLAHALADAAERGQETSTLVATQLGRPVYERLGFRPLGALQMWERRRAPR
jgi:ribosomal protein S18 acetylase RimI-like enzyme